MELCGDIEAMIGTMKAPGQSVVIAKDGRGFEQIADLRSVARRIGLRDRTAFHVEDCGDNIEVVFMNIAPGSPLRRKRGPSPVHRPWHDLDVGRWLVMPKDQVKNPASLRVQVSKWAADNGKQYSVLTRKSGYMIKRRA